MLRITEVGESELPLLLRLEGKLREPWVDELARLSQGAGNRPLRLDLSAVTFVDDAGIRLLRSLMGRGAEVTASAFVAEMLRREDS